MVVEGFFFRDQEVWNLVAMYRAMRLRFGNGFEWCDESSWRGRGVTDRGVTAEKVLRDFRRFSEVFRDF